MFEEFDNDGWEQSDTEQYVEEDHSHQVRYRIDQGLNILQSRQHSLEPDMISGWRPKLPSCPLPISYPNTYVDAIVKHLIATNNFSIAYMGPRYINSVQINQRYNYYWKYRERYSLNLAIVKEAVKNVGKQDRQAVKVTKGNYEFDSAFESGNLDMAVQVKKQQYDCFIRSDTNTKGHTNWYYFKVKNENEGTIKINICNMTKTRNLYSKGMKPFVKVGQNGQWSQELCSEVLFVERYCRYGFDKKTYQLQFNFSFTQKNQEVYFAYAIPYTYTRLQSFVKQIKESYSHCAKVQKLCESLGGIELPLLTITNNPVPLQGLENQNVNYKQEKKKAIVITGRIHPGQSHSSHVLEGFIRYLLNNSEESQILRNMFVFYIVPMLNPDGVIAGNFRTSYIGKDLNRQFSKLNKYLFPQITYLCDFCSNLKRSYLKGIQFYFDFHGHSAKKNLFCYGPQHHPSKLYFFKARALAKIIEKIHPIFSYKKSIFTINQHKKSTGRNYMLNKLKIPMTFTFEISNGMYENEKKTNVLLNSNILIDAGKIIFKGLFRYVQIEMRIPKKFVKAKVDTRNPRNKLSSAQSIRHNSEIYKKRSSKQLPELRLSKSKAKNKSNSQDDEKGDKNHSKEFLALIKQIKNEEDQIEIEGGSDSEGSSEDFSKEDTNNLFSQVLKRNNCKDYKNQKVRRLKNGKLNFRKQEVQNKEVVTQEGESKKYRSSRLLDLSKPPLQQQKQLKRGISSEYQKIVVAQKNFTMLI